VLLCGGTPDDDADRSGATPVVPTGARRRAPGRRCRRPAPARGV